MTTNSTPQDDLGELDKLLVGKMIDGLKAETTTASFLAVVERYLGSRRAAMKPQAPTIPHGPVPFPRLDPDAYDSAVKPPQKNVGALRSALAELGPVPFPKTESDAPTMAEALQKPFAADGDTP
jgi:hypothetical protein